MSRPRLLDLFAGAGGAAVGYHRAGFDVVGVDIKPQPRYPFEFYRGDALAILREERDWPPSYVLPEVYEEWAEAWRHLDLSNFDAIHASPPCQAYIRGGLATGDHPDLLPETRRLLEATGLPWVIENVPGAPMRADAMLCGSMFGLEVRRHRWFEFSWGEPMMAPAVCDHSRPVAGVYGNPHGQAGAAPGMLPSDLETWSRAMGIDWMESSELAVAIPPAYTEHIGHQLMQVVMHTRDAQKHDETLDPCSERDSSRTRCPEPPRVSSPVERESGSQTPGSSPSGAGIPTSDPAPIVPHHIEREVHP